MLAALSHFEENKGLQERGCRARCWGATRITRGGGGVCCGEVCAAGGGVRRACKLCFHGEATAYYRQWNGYSRLLDTSDSVIVYVKVAFLPPVSCSRACDILHYLLIVRMPRRSPSSACALALALSSQALNTLVHDSTLHRAAEHCGCCDPQGVAIPPESISLNGSRSQSLTFITV